ncbi:hypoxanthine phosphoribosyltransferase [Sulfobacillus thermosulfidooxidans]|uniref:Hypoxanthine phosphoribosyltransferase n=2 Tax=Sulfobacillus thermosulfidooxidans TaxID=28034 RepID=A0A1W1WGQ4_SULTA|nr:hypoxanthine phosphoribosyltransferase [Sulfobacillus thermosulfidooxidans]OLZ09978.1 hypoxanthine phosphoribosyltransferase [Sulfobacillus thermosulfidooxidans]OLZ15717.1 hypoxanthine phosphoribosyltransferase [Sulfobacillus thermosulfidooxidans]OLZ18436.1 hypoxanthine phosphoribosyltransferase [Sulfobacillus thermosulfidooxidans]PSR28212.1 MAG: hypoxanthine phosphoribosyltransferase [Sulfobacillus thermosulfidooxidans]SMC05484.1 hypoxanthine phosphoribosyltransferase [Sulfobacillus thermo
MQGVQGEELEVLLSAKDIASRVESLGKRITLDYQNKPLILIGILKGSFIFLADLIRAIDLPVAVDFMALSSYGSSTKSSGVVRIIKDLDHSLEGHHVLVVEDIVDTGLTLNYIYGHVKSRGALSVKICSLLDKPSRRQVAVPLHYKGFEIPDEFVVGYGLDVGERYRNLPDVCKLVRANG